MSCTGAPEALVCLADVVTARGSNDRPLTVIDLVLPRRAARTHVAAVAVAGTPVEVVMKGARPSR